MQSNLMNVAMRNGLIIGLLFSVNFLLTATKMGAFVLLSYLITGVIIYYTYRYTVQYRDKDNNGKISFWQAFTFVFMLYIFATIISSFVKYLFLRFTDTTFLTDMFNQNVVILEQILPTVSDEMYNSLEIITQPQGYTMMAAWSNIIMAVIIGLIIAAIVKRTPTPFDNSGEQ